MLSASLTQSLSATSRSIGSLFVALSISLGISHEANAQEIQLLGVSSARGNAARAGLLASASVPSESGGANTKIATTGTAGSGTYTIQSGDTLFKIAKSLGIILSELRSANPGLAPENLQPGQTIRTPNSSRSPTAETASWSASENNTTANGSSTSVGDHKAQIDRALTLAGVPVTAANESAVDTIVQHESGWNPNAINKTDSNAAAGDPSRGLMQTIGATFREYALPGYNQNIFDPLSNLIAGIRYAVRRYGSLQNVPGVLSLARNGSYVPY